MSNTNRADRIELLSKSLKKHYKPTNIAVDRPVLDLLLYACCLEDAKFEAADEAFARLQQTYFDWNEVRVTTVAELGEVLGSLPNPNAAASRIKRSLQALFEHRYSFDLDELRKANLGKTVSDMESWPGMTKFVISFVAQNALGGHAIPVDQAAMEIFKLFEIVTPQEAEKGQVPGLERAIAKSKGPEFATLLHQFAAEFKVDPKSSTALALFKECGVNPKPKAPPPPPPKPAKKAVEPTKATPAASGKNAAENSSTSEKSGSAKGKPSELPTGDAKKAASAASKKASDTKIATGKASEAAAKTAAAKKSAPPSKSAAPAPPKTAGTGKQRPVTKAATPGKTNKPKAEKPDHHKDAKSKKTPSETKKPTAAKKSAPPPPAKKIASKPVAKTPEKNNKVDNKKITKKKPK